MLTSYAKVRSEPTFEDLGLSQQVELYRSCGEPVLDARDVLTAPERILRVLCEAVGVQFSDGMLSWRAGGRPSGVWGRYWYDSVWRSAGFSAYRPRTQPVARGRTR